MERTEFVALGYRVEKLVPVGEYWDLLRWEYGGWIWIDNVGQATADRIKSEATEVLVSASMTESKSASHGLAVGDTQTNLCLVDDRQKELETSQFYYEKKLSRVAKHAEKYMTTDQQLADFRRLIADEATDTRNESE